MVTHSRYNRPFLREIRARLAPGSRLIFMSNTDALRYSTIVKMSIQARALERSDPEPNDWILILHTSVGTSYALSLHQSDPNGGTIIVCNSYESHIIRHKGITIPLRIRKPITIKDCVDTLAQAGLLGYRLNTDGSGNYRLPKPRSLLMPYVQESFGGCQSSFLSSRCVASLTAEMKKRLRRFSV